MPRDGNGNYYRTDGIYTGSNVFQQEAANGLNDEAITADYEGQDMAEALTASIANDGQTPILANLPMSGFKHTAVADGTAINQYSSVGQLRNNTNRFAAAGGTADALTATFSPVITGPIADGLTIYVRATATNATATPTLAVDGISAKDIIANSGTNEAGMIQSGGIYEFGYRLSTDKFVLMNPSVNTANYVYSGFKNGLTMSTAGSSSSLAIASGQATDSTGLVLINFAGLTKTTASWAVGNNQGGLDTGAISPSTLYAVYLIRRPDTGVVDVVFSLNTTSPALPTNYTQYRRIGYWYTDGSSNWLLIWQNNNNFILDIKKSSTLTGSTTAALVTAPLPPNSNAIMHIQIYAPGVGTSSVSTLFSEVRQTNDTSGTYFTAFSLREAGFISIGSADITLRLDSNSQYRHREDNTTSGFTATYTGWIDDF